MNPLTNSTSIHRSARRFLYKKWKEFDDVYYLYIDELDQKLADMGMEVPNVRISQFKFIDDWLMGYKSSKEVRDILSKINVNAMAEKVVTRRLRKFMVEQPVVSEYIAFAISKLNEQAVPKYVSYMSLLKTYFDKLVKIDNEQIPVVWVEVTENEEEPKKSKFETREMSLNQFRLFFDASYFGGVESSIAVDKNIIVFHESSKSKNYLHWVFAPESHIKVLRSKFRVTEERSSKDYKGYILNLIGAIV